MMETIIRKIDVADMNAADFAEAAEILRNSFSSCRTLALPQ